MGLTTPNHWFKKFLAKNDLPVRHLHCTRHTNATILISNGADYNTVAYNLGHVDESLILKVYGHATKKGKDKAKEILEKTMTV